MFKRFTFLAAMLLASAAAAQQAQQAPQAQDPAALFGAREAIEHIDLSPNGQRVVYLTPGPGARTVVLVQDLTGQQQPRVVVSSDGNPERIRWCNFVTDDRLVCRISALVASNNMSLVPFTRLMSVDISGENPRLLGQTESAFDAQLRQFDGAILEWAGSEDGTVLMSRAYVPEAGRIGTRLSRQGDGLGVDRINVRTLRSTPVEPPNPQATQFITDGRGNVRIMGTRLLLESTGQESSTTRFHYRAPGDRRWQQLGTYDSLTGEGMLPLAVDQTLNSAYVLQKLNGRFALYRIRLDGSMATELVYFNPEVDVDDVVRAERGSRVIGVTFADESRRIVYFDPNYAALARSLGRAVPNLPLIDFAESTADGNRLLIHAGSDSDPGRYYVYDRGSRRLNEILLVRPQLERARLASVRPVTFPSTDGTQVPGYLTLPPGSDGRNLPAVVLPHGGPAARDEWGFDWLAQYLAQLGYAVLQPNYRGSAGYGDQWLQQNGFRGWRTSIDDITSGARWMAQQGIADSRRMAILGWSYGGYAALQSGVTQPSLFRAVVAIAPVTDLQQVVDDHRNFTTASNVAQYIGTGPHVAEGSPLRHASRLTAPVLLFHGERDLNVPVAHSRRMDAALRSAGRRSELMLFPGLEHDLGDGDARRRMLERIRAFLDENMRG